MANLLAKYGIKEVSDVTFYELDSVGAPSAPVLYLDTLKVSTTEQSAESSDATGGKGNGVLISWDYGRDITVTLEDALFSAKSMALMFGGSLTDYDGKTQKMEVLKTFTPDSFTVRGTSWVTEIAQQELEFPFDTLSANGKFYKYSGEVVNLVAAPKDGTKVDATAFDYVTVDLSDYFITHGQDIRVDANAFPGTYYVTGDTYARNAANGKDEFFQLVFPRAKIKSDDVSLTMEADGDPSTFSLNLRVMRGKNGRQIELKKYGIGDPDATKNKHVAKLLTEYDAAGRHDDYTA